MELLMCVCVCLKDQLSLHEWDDFFPLFNLILKLKIILNNAKLGSLQFKYRMQIRLAFVDKSTRKCVLANICSCPSAHFVQSSSVRVLWLIFPSSVQMRIKEGKFGRNTFSFLFFNNNLAHIDIKCLDTQVALSQIRCVPINDKNTKPYKLKGGNESFEHFGQTQSSENFSSYYSIPEGCCRSYTSSL